MNFTERTVSRWKARTSNGSFVLSLARRSCSFSSRYARKTIKTTSLLLCASSSSTSDAVRASFLAASEAGGKAEWAGSEGDTRDSSASGMIVIWSRPRPKCGTGQNRTGGESACSERNVR
jgi:hypothetical protein